MLANLRRKVGLVSGMQTPAPMMPPPSFAENMIVPHAYVDPNLPQPITMEELGFAWPANRGIFSPSAIPLWLQEQVGGSVAKSDKHVTTDDKCQNRA